jgi:hypothetical protein
MTIASNGKDIEMLLLQQEIAPHFRKKQAMRAFCDLLTRKVYIARHVNPGKGTRRKI